MTAPTIRISSVGEMVALLPHYLGYHPRRSLVVLCIHRVRVGERPTLRLGLVARMDLPPAGEEEAVLDQALETVGREEPDLVTLVAVEEEDDGTELLDRLGRGCLDLGVTVVQEVRVREDRYLWLTDPDGPPRWRDVPETADVPAALTYVLRGEVPVADRQALERMLAPEGDLTQRAVEGMFFQRLDRGHPLGGEEHRERAAVLWGRALAVPEDPRVPDDPSAEELTELLMSLLDIEFRDCLLAVLAPRPFRLAGLPDDLVHHLETEVRPVVTDGPGLVDRLAVLVRRAPPLLSAPVLTLLGVVCWSRGDGTLANIAVERALAEAPHYRLAQLLDTALAQGLPPHGRLGADDTHEGAA